jgi:hypothetical protein
MKTDQELKDQHKKQEQWFIDRIGKRVYRPATSCKCGVCAEITMNGLIINDKMHASYLNDISTQMDVKYQDEPLFKFL